MQSKMESVGRVVFSIATVLLMSGCTTNPVSQAASPLRKYIEEYGFTEFKPPRSTDGVGTVISFNSEGEETIVSSRSTCLPAAQVPSLPPGEQSVALLSGSYRIDRSNELEIGLSKHLTQEALGIPIDLEGSFGVDGVKQVEIEFIRPFRDRIERVAAKNYIRSLDADDTCLEEFLRQSTLIIHTVLGAKGIRYRFVGEGGNRIAITADIVNSLNVGDKYEETWEGKFGIEVDGDILIGYIPWQASNVPGANAQDIELLELNANQVQAVKTLSQ